MYLGLLLKGLGYIFMGNISSPFLQWPRRIICRQCEKGLKRFLSEMRANIIRDHKIILLLCRRMEWFHYLPIEIWHRIIEFGVNTKNILCLKLVSKRFKSLVEKAHDPNEYKGRHFKWNIQCGHMKEITRLLQDERILVGMNVCRYFYYICAFGDLQMVKSVIDDPRVNPNFGRNPPIVVAYLYGKMNIVDFLFDHEKVDLQSDQIRIFSHRVECLNLLERVALSPRVNLNDRCFRQIYRTTIERGRISFLKKLLEKYASRYSAEMIDDAVYYVLCNEQVLNLLLDSPIVDSASLGMRTGIYRKGLKVCMGQGFLETAEKILVKGIQLGTMNFYGGSKKFDKRILELVLKSPNVTLENYFHRVPLDDEELVKVILKNCSTLDLRCKLFQEALVQRKGDIVKHLVKSGYLNLSNLSFGKMFGEEPSPEAIKFALDDLGITLSKIQCREAFSLAIDEGDGELLEFLLSSERIIKQLPLEFIKNQLLPDLCDRKEMADIILKFV